VAIYKELVERNNHAELPLKNKMPKTLSLLQLLPVGKTKRSFTSFAEKCCAGSIVHRVQTRDLSLPVSYYK
jgi:hypothetical protein